MSVSTRTSFGPRSSTNVPPATQAYEPLVKSVLSHRLLYNVFAYSAAFTLVSTAFLISDDDASLLFWLFRPSTWVTACLAWLVGVLPIVMVRKVFLTPTAESAPSPSKTMAAAFAKPATRRWIAIYFTSSILLLSLALARISFLSEDMRMSIFIKSRKFPYHLNGRLLFLALAYGWLSVSFAFRNVMLERFVFRWARAVPSSSAPFVPRNLVMTLLATMLFTFSSFVIYNLAFGMVRMIILPVLLWIPLVRSLLKPFVGRFIRGPWTLTLPLRHLSLELRTLTLGLSMLANWEFAESLFDVYIPQPIKVASSTVDPNVTLVSGITSTNPIYLHFAYAELCDDASNDTPASAARRTALFSDQKFSPSLWNVLARESLVHLGRDYQTLLRRGTPAPAPATEGPTTVPPKPTQQPPTTPLLRKPIYKQASRSPVAKVLDTLGSDSDLSKAAEAVASEVGSRLMEAPIPELFRSVSAPPAAAAAPSTTTSTAPATVPFQSQWINAQISHAKAQCQAWVVAYAPAWSRGVVAQWDAWWRRDRVHKLVEKSLPNRDLDALIIQVLTHLVCASLTEDRYGVVQRDIPRILEALLSFLTALETYHAEVTKLYVAPTPDEIAQGDAKLLADKERARVEVAKATEVICVVADALKSGVADITRTFGEKLVAFKFPPRIAHKLQSFVDYA